MAVADPDDIANALLFLAPDEARYITGVTFPADAGALAKQSSGIPLALADRRDGRLDDFPAEHRSPGTAHVEHVARILDRDGPWSST